MTIDVPGVAAPTNLHLSPEVRVGVVEGDLYHICERIREISTRLYIIDLADDDKHAFAIMENCEDGVQRLIFKVRELDARVLDRLRRILAMPLNARMEKLEKEEYQLQEEVREEELEQLYERVGRPMWTELERCGFIQRGVSYPKLGVAAPGRAR